MSDKSKPNYKKTSIYKSQAITIKKIADTLGVSMEYVMSLENNKDFCLNLEQQLLEQQAQQAQQIQAVQQLQQPQQNLVA